MGSDYLLSLASSKMFISEPMPSNLRDQRFADGSIIAID